MRKKCSYVKQKYANFLFSFRFSAKHIFVNPAAVSRPGTGESREYCRICSGTVSSLRQNLFHMNPLISDFKGLRPEQVCGDHVPGHKTDLWTRA